MDTIVAQGGIRDALKSGDLAKTRRVAFIIVDAQTQEKARWRLLDEIPGLDAILGASSTIMINKYNFETIDLLRRYAGEWARVDGAAGAKPIEIYIAHIAFASLPDKTERDYFQAIPTALTLPEEQVDKLREVAGRLLYAQEPFRKLVTDLGGKMPESGQPRLRMEGCSRKMPAD